MHQAIQKDFVHQIDPSDINEKFYTIHTVFHLLMHSPLKYEQVLSNSVCRF